MTPRWRVWLIFGAGVLTLGAGMILGHALLLVIGLGITGCSGIASASRGEDPVVEGTSRVAPGGVRLGQMTTRRGHRFVVLDTGQHRRLLVYEPDRSRGEPVWAVELDTDEAYGVAMLLQNRATGGVPAEAEELLLR